MSAVLIDGKALAAEIRAETAEKAGALRRRGVTPCLAVILAGENPASVSYVTGKRKALAEAGMADRSVCLPETVTEAEMLKLIGELNRDPAVHGILVQLPLPAGISEENVIAAIAPEKDVDGFHPVNAGNLLIGRKAFLPCTPHGIIVMLRRAGIRTDGARAVVIGRSNIVGKPVALLLARKDCNATVTLCHTGTKNLAEITRTADILIAAAGRPKTVTADMVKPGAAVIDVGVNRIPDASKKSGFRLVGDVDFDAVREKAAFITPVPGGVGPMTIAMLMVNTLEAAENAANAAGGANAADGAGANAAAGAGAGTAAGAGANATTQCANTADGAGANATAGAGANATTAAPQAADANAADGAGANAAAGAGAAGAGADAAKA